MNQVNEYLETQVMTASPEQLHLMVVDGAIRKATLALEALEKKDFEKTHETLNESRDFVGELISGVKGDGQNSDFVIQMKTLFAFAYKRLVEADIQHKTELITEAIQVLQHHRETWLQLCEHLKTDKKAAPTHGLNGPHNWTM